MRSQSGELPANADTASLAAFFAMTIQGLAVQARDGAKHAMLKRLAELAMQARPEAALPKAQRESFNVCAGWPKADAAFAL